MSGFLLASPSQSSSSTPAYTDSPALASDADDDQDTLPYPTELPRNDFLSQGFDPQTYLSSLRNRHQTLEDLRSDLRQRSQLLNRELLDLVNGNYEEFLSLGGDLRDGGEKVEGVRVGLLAFQREVEGIRRAVTERSMEMRHTLDEKKCIRKGIVLARKLVDVAERVEELEERLGISEGEGTLGESEESEDEGNKAHTSSNGNGTSSSARRLSRHCGSYALIKRHIDSIGDGHPFLNALQPRMDELRKTILLDLSSALREARLSHNTSSTMTLVQLFGELGAEKGALGVLRHG